MPIYTYDCESCGGETDLFAGMASRPDETECQECGAIAQKREINWRPPPKPKNTHVLYGEGQPVEQFMKKERLMQFKCEKCTHVTFEWFKGKVESVDCELESCNGTAKRIYKMKLDMHWARYPYFDRGLGITLTSERHRREVCKQRGLTPVDGDFNMDPYFAEADKEIAEETEVYNDYVDRLEHDPAYKDWRKARDEGQVPDMLPLD